MVTRDILGKLGPFLQIIFVESPALHKTLRAAGNRGMRPQSPLNLLSADIPIKGLPFPVGFGGSVPLTPTPPQIWGFLKGRF